MPYIILCLEIIKKKGINTSQIEYNSNLFIKLLKKKEKKNGVVLAYT